MSLSKDHLVELKHAKTLLEKTSFVIKATNTLGAPIEKGMSYLPKGAQNLIAKATQASLDKSLEWVSKTLDDAPAKASPRLHTAAAALSGAIGGAFGISALAIELPLSTSLMMRSIADIARENGETISSVETRLQCLSVFSLGGHSANADAAESGYYAVRASLAGLVSDAALHLGGRKASASMVEKIPALASLVGRIATRFNIQVSEKAMAQLVPLIGAAGGAAVNTLFIQHFQDVSRGHFTVRRLERKYGVDAVQQAYLGITL